jgi:hypothetical protein
LRDVGIQESDVTTADGAVAVAIRDGGRLDEAVTAIRRLTAPCQA